MPLKFMASQATEHLKPVLEKSDSAFKRDVCAALMLTQTPSLYYYLYYNDGVNSSKNRGLKMITLRLDSKLEQSLQNTAKTLGVTKSELIRRSISDYLDKLSSPSPWELGKHSFGKYSSGAGNLSEDRKTLLKTKIQDKRK